MLTVLEAIKLSDEYLQKYKIESSRLNAELLLTDILNCKRLDLYLLYDRPLKNDELNKYREYLKRRIKREPLQYIIGHVEFYGLKFMVNPSVLIPRQETELLVEYAIKQAEISKRIKILDIGVGSGNISIALLKNLPDSFVLGIDISEDALTLSEFNAKQNIVEDRLELKKFDIQKDDPATLGKFDLIISNPPYISLEDFESLEPELNVYEPAVALTDYSNGYSFYERIILVSKQILNSNGKLFFELGEGHHQKVADMLKLNGFTKINIYKDYSNIERIISGEF